MRGVSIYIHEVCFTAEEVAGARFYGTEVPGVEGIVGEIDLIFEGDSNTDARSWFSPSSPIEEHTFYTVQRTAEGEFKFWKADLFGQVAPDDVITLESDLALPILEHDDLTLGESEFYSFTEENIASL